MKKDNRIVNVRIVASMSADHLQDFLQNIRDYDMKHNGQIPFQILVACPTMTAEEIEAVYKNIKPPMPFFTKADLRTGEVTSLELKPDSYRGPRLARAWTYWKRVSNPLHAARHAIDWPLQAERVAAAISRAVDFRCDVDRNGDVSNGIHWRCSWTF